jgi:3-deoxy-D-manno-octulosonate 8-phosphate phosphatase (KDO 8-P phosphatase)
MNLSQKCSAIRLILSDVDGVLTDGRLIYSNAGIESKCFHIRDGQGIRLWQQNGLAFGIVTARSSQVVKLRAKELDIAIVRQGAKDKLAAVREIAAEQGLTLADVCYVGDDLPDLAPIQSVGLGVAVADAAEDVRQGAGYVTSLPGGQGAIREVVELILKNTNRWETTIRKYSI